MLLKPLEHEIRTSSCDRMLVADRELLSLPARYGGMGILNPTAESDFAHANSLQISLPLVRLILRQESEFDPRELETSVKEIRKEIDKRCDDSHKERAKLILTPLLKFAYR